MKRIVPVVMAGGMGSRLSPLSQIELPKQFIKFFDNFSSFQKTLLRNKVFGKILVVTIEEYKDIVIKQSLEINLEIDIIIEPFKKNTAASFIASAFLFYNEKVTLLFLPADHEISLERKYLNLIKTATELQEESLVTFGIVPNNMNSEFGYIIKGEVIEKNCYQVKSFYEKPSLCYIKKRLNNEHVFWNSGIYLISAQYLLEQALVFQKKIYKQIYDSYILSARHENILYLAKKPYEKIKDISFDEALTRFIKNKVIFSADFYWQDLGHFESIAKILYNKVGDNDKLIKNLIKQISAFNVFKNSSNKLNQTEIFYRQWGYYRLLASSNNFKFKELIIHSNSSISLQYHEYRAEFWVVSKGCGELITGKTETTLCKSLLQAGDFIYIPIKTVHQVINNTNEDIKIIELQIGIKLDENDIVRSDGKLAIYNMF